MNNSRSIQGLRDSLLLLLWGGFVLWLSFTGRLSIYLHPSLQPYTTASGVVFLLLAVFVFRSYYSRMLGQAISHQHHHECEDHGHDHGCDHGYHHHDSGEGLGALIFKTVLLLLPLAIIISGKATAYSITTVQNRGVVDNISKLPSAQSAAASTSFSSVPSSAASPTLATIDSSASLTSTTNASVGPMPLQVIDMLYAVQMPSYRSEFEGKNVELVGQYIPMTTGNPKGDRFQAIRMFMTCCAADAKPVGVTVQYSKPLKVSEMDWVKITGKPIFPMEGGKRTALLEATKVEECPAPSEPFVY
jgi:uncharacterized repeat protein (TIGR03943 family)